MLREYATRFPDGTLVRWRPIKYGEFKQLTLEFGNYVGSAATLLYSAVADLCIIDILQDNQSVTIEEAYAGTIITVGQQITEQTGFYLDHKALNTKLNEARGVVQGSYFESAKAIVCGAFQYKPEEAENWSMHELLVRLAMAERFRDFSLGAPIDPANPEDKEQEQKVITTDDGRKIPLLTKNDLSKRNRINFGQSAQRKPQ